MGACLWLSVILFFASFKVLEEEMKKMSAEYVKRRMTQELKKERYDVDIMVESEATDKSEAEMLTGNNKLGHRSKRN